MSFLDRSSLIVDAVLTDKGREELSKNQFEIVKFALGDDDIDYSLYNESNSKMLMADLDIDKGNNRDVYSSEKVRSIPTFICYVNGERRDVLADSDLEEVQAFFKQCNDY